MMYHHVGKYLFMKPILFLIALLSMSGFVLFFSFEHSLRHLSLQSSYHFLYVVLIMLISTVLHEIAHALTCIHFNRSVNEAGFMIYFFMPVFFVNTSDIWMAGKKERILVSLSGPITDFFIGSLISLIHFLCYDNMSTLLYSASIMSYFRMLLNVNPLLKWDGYYVFIDIVGISSLREKSMRFICKEFTTKLKNKEKMLQHEKYLLLYGLLSISFSIFLIYSMMALGIKNLMLGLTMGLNSQTAFSVLALAPFGVFCIGYVYEKIKKMYRGKRR